MDEEKPLITRNQAIFLGHQAKHKKTVREGKRKFFTREVILIVITFIFAFFLVNFPGYSKMAGYWWNNLHKHSTPAQPTKQVSETTPTTSVEPALTTQESSIRISKLNITAPIIWDISYDQIHANLANGVVHYANSAHPGEIGNVFIVGHSSDYVWSTGKYKNIFALLPKLAAGDDVTISYHGKDYIYRVDSTKIVAPTATDIINPTSDATLTLMTCWPVGTSQKRYVVTAKLISPAPSGKQATQPSVLNLPKAR